MDGLSYRTFTYHSSKVHLLEVDLTKRELRPVLAADAFPFLRIYPVKEAIAEGALGAVGGGFNITWFHHQGVADQPLHAMVIDGEVWTTGVGAGGYGLLLGESSAYIQQNRISIHVWRPDNTAIDVGAVNLGHDDRVVAFTSRGGTNDRPMEGKHYALLTPAGEWELELGSSKRDMQVLDVSMFTPLQPQPGTVVLEGRWPLKLAPGDQVSWVQRLGPSGVKTIVSGWPQIIKAGENIVPLMGLHGEASHGPDNWFIRKNPRMAVGVSEDHHTAFLCAVEGRIPGSPGLRLKELATMLLHHGAHDAVNFDGGGSAFMWFDGELVSDSCYGDGTLDGLRPDHYAISVF